MVEDTARLVWGKVETGSMTTGLPFRVQLTAENEIGEQLTDYCRQLTITALTSKVCLSEGFEGRRLGLWCAHLPFPRALRCAPPKNNAGETGW
jgi:hypothetical protein